MKDFVILKFKKNILKLNNYYVIAQDTINKKKIKKA